MQETSILLIVIILFLLAIVFFLFRQTRKLQESLGKVIADYEGKIRDLQIKHQQEIEKARRQSVEQSRHTIKGQVAEQLATLLPGFPYLPSDCRFIGDPVDYLVIKGYTDYKDDRKNNSEPIEIIIADIKRGQANLTEGQKKIAEAIKTGKVRFEVIRIADDGAVSVQTKSTMPEATVQQGPEWILNTQDRIENEQSAAILGGSEKYSNAYKPWTSQDDTLLKEKFQAGATVEELASILQRQPGAIQSRLRKLGLNS